MGGTLGFGSGSRLLEWWSSGQVEVFQLGSTADPCKKVGSGAYIVGVVAHPYLATWLPLWLTMLSHTSTMLAILAVGHASAGKGVGLTCVRPAVRPLAPPYLHPTSFPRRVGHVGGPVVRGRADVMAGSPSVISFFPAGKTFSRCPMRRELGNLNSAGADPTEQELGNLNSAGADPTEQELGN
ncbi:hypothetical protein B296_00032273 [Ensete ventricosum]|uniref:Uncharacterized protein n=1 Tax=Ensete ventricosum TaxID=4639 RepID=A0A426Y0Y3_ENSVE|nr:hypothetical protein B296_00032273 [Ensete ventricosum]